MKKLILNKKKINREVRDLEEKIITAATSGKPTEIQGRAYYVQSDLQHLKELMNGKC